MNREEELGENLARVRKTLPDHVTLICVTKTYPISDIELLFELGQRDFGENRVDELAQKAPAIEATWHFQGQIQSNKLKSIAEYADVVHSFDDERHVRKLDSVTTRRIGGFIQVSLDGATGRGGVLPEGLHMMGRALSESANIDLMGLMAVAPLGEDPEHAFSRLSAIHRDFLREFPMATALSAGMSGDYLAAIKYGATHVRIGSQILGSRTSLR